MWMPLRASKMNGFIFGIPTFGLVSEMNACIQQFFNSNTNHNFPLVRDRSQRFERTIPRNTGLI